jgi:hypothetical protein
MDAVDDRWHVAVGDPTFAGWLVCGLYAACAVMCWRAHRSSRYGHLVLARSAPREAQLQLRLSISWLGASVVMALLALNKQLDLQTWVIQTGRDLAHEQGWYAHRHEAQAAFFWAFAAGGTTLAGAAAWWLAPVARRLRLPAGGFIVLALFVLIRAAEFVHVGLHSSAVIDRWGWLLEVVGAALIGWGALRGTVTTERAGP